MFPGRKRKCVVETLLSLFLSVPRDSHRKHGGSVASYTRTSTRKQERRGREKNKTTNIKHDFRNGVSQIWLFYEVCRHSVSNLFLVIEQRAPLRTCTLYDLSFRDSGWINSRAIIRYRDAPSYKRNRSLACPHCILSLLFRISISTAPEETISWQGLTPNSGIARDDNVLRSLLRAERIYSCVVKTIIRLLYFPNIIDVRSFGGFPIPLFVYVKNIFLTGYVNKDFSQPIFKLKLNVIGLLFKILDWSQRIEGSFFFKFFPRIVVTNNNFIHFLIFV